MKSIQLLMMNKKAGGWDLSTASYDSVSFSVSSQDTQPDGLFFKPDGTKMYVVGISGKAYQYSLSTAWDLSTASYDSVYFSFPPTVYAPMCFFFKPDGTKMYFVAYGRDAQQYSLSTAWDLSTASYDSVSFSVSSQDTSPTGLFFKPDGTKMYITGNGNKRAYQYSLSTAWDLSTASYDSVYINLYQSNTYLQDIFFKPDGNNVYFLFNNNYGDKYINQYSLSTPWDLSTASYDSVSFSVSSQDTSPTGLFFKQDGTKMYIAGNGSDSVYQYSLT